MNMILTIFKGAYSALPMNLAYTPVQWKIPAFPKFICWKFVGKDGVNNYSIIGISYGGFVVYQNEALCDMRESGESQKKEQKSKEGRGKKGEEVHFLEIHFEVDF